MVYLDNILIFSKKKDQHQEDVTMVLQWLREYQLYTKLSKCSFETMTVSFLEFIMDMEGVRMDPEWVQTIEDWLVPQSFKDIQVFLGFMNFYRQFIFCYSIMTTPITELLKGMQKGKKTGPYLFTKKAREVFQKLKEVFKKEPLLQHFNPSKPIRLETDASIFVAGAVLSQPWDDNDGNGKQWHPVAFWSFKFEPAE